MEIFDCVVGMDESVLGDVLIFVLVGDVVIDQGYYLMLVFVYQDIESGIFVVLYVLDQFQIQFLWCINFGYEGLYFCQFN